MTDAKRDKSIRRIAERCNAALDSVSPSRRAKVDDPDGPLQGPRRNGWQGPTAQEVRKWIGRGIEADLYHTDATKTYYPNDCLAFFGILEDVRKVDGVMALVFNGNDGVALASVAAIHRLKGLERKKWSPQVSSPPYVVLSPRVHVQLHPTDPNKPVVLM
jgi:hypothetical protein